MNDVTRHNQNVTGDEGLPEIRPSVNVKVIKPSPFQVLYPSPQASRVWCLGRCRCISFSLFGLWQAGTWPLACLVVRNPTQDPCLPTIILKLTWPKLSVLSMQEGLQN